MALTSGNHTAAAADTPEALETSANGKNFSSGFLTLDPAASGPARFGGPTVSVANKIGAVINPGETVPLYPSHGVVGHNTSAVFLAFTGNAAGDNVGWTIVR